MSKVVGFDEEICHVCDGWGGWMVRDLCNEEEDGQWVVCEHCQGDGIEPFHKKKVEYEV